MKQFNDSGSRRSNTIPISRHRRYRGYSDDIPREGCNCFMCRTHRVLTRQQQYLEQHPEQPWCDCPSCRFERGEWPKT